MKNLFIPLITASIYAHAVVIAHLVNNISQMAEAANAIPDTMIKLADKDNIDSSEKWIKITCRAIAFRAASYAHRTDNAFDMQ